MVFLNGLKATLFKQPANQWKLNGLLIIIFISLLWPTLRSVSIIQDFHVFYGAAEKLVGHSNIYKHQYIYGYWYYYSVMFAGLLAPFTYFPIEFSKALWAILNLWMIFRVFKNIILFAEISPKKNSLFTIIATLWFLFFYLLYVNITSGQVTILILFLCLEGYKHLLKGNRHYSGMLIAFGINIKLLPVVLVIPWLQNRQYKSLLWGIIIFSALLIAPLLLLDFDYYKDLTVAWVDKVNPFHNDHVEEVGEGGFIDLAGIITKYFCSFKIRDEIIISWFNFSKSSLFILTNILRIIFITAMTFLTYKFQKQNNGKPLLFKSFALWLAAIPVLIPHQRDYSLLFLSPLITLLVCEFYDKKIKPVYLICFFISVLLMTMHPILFIKSKMLVQIITSFRIQGIGALLFLSTYLFKEISHIIKTEKGSTLALTTIEVTRS